MRRDHGRLTLDDIQAIWLGNGVELSVRVKEHIDKWRGSKATVDQVLDELEDILTAEYNPVTGTRLDFNPLDLPPLRPAAPDHTVDGHKPKRAEPGS